MYRCSISLDFFTTVQPRLVGVASAYQFSGSAGNCNFVSLSLTIGLDHPSSLRQKFLLVSWETEGGEEVNFETLLALKLLGCRGSQKKLWKYRTVLIWLGE